MSAGRGPMENRQHEAYASHRATGMERADAYLAAYQKDPSEVPRHHASKYGWALDQRKDIRRRIGEIQKERFLSGLEDEGVDQEFIVAALRTVVSRGLQIEKVYERGEHKGEFKFNGAVVNQAAKILAELHGFSKGMGKEDGADLTQEQFIDWLRETAGELGFELTKKRTSDASDSERSDPDGEGARPKPAAPVPTVQ